MLEFKLIYHIAKALLIYCIMFFISEFVLNPVGKSPVCILHEYAQHTLKVQPRYAFQELGNYVYL